MANVKLEKLVGAAPEAVFTVAADLVRWPEVIRGVKAVEVLTPGAVGVGTRFRETRVMFGREAVEEMEITAFDPPQGYALQARTCGALFVSEHRFVPDAAGTRIELTISTKPLTLLARLMAPLGWLMMGAMKKMIDADLEDLKAAVEKA